MLYACCAQPGFCLGACLCAPCVAYWMRDKIVQDHPYVCCLGKCPAPCLTGECPKIPCLCCEICCCIGIAVSATRIHVMQSLEIQPDYCDQYLICCSNVLQIVACIMSVCDVPGHECVENLADLFFCIVLACMQTQVHYQFQKHCITLGSTEIWVNVYSA